MVLVWVAMVAGVVLGGVVVVVAVAVVIIVALVFKSPTYDE